MSTPFQARTRREFAYAWLTIAPAIVVFALLPVALVAGALSLVAVGLPLLTVCLVLARHATGLFRRPARALLAWPWPPPSPRSGARLRDRQAWGALAYCAVKSPITAVAVYTATVGLILGATALTAPLWWPFWHSVLGLYDLTSWPQTLLLAVQGAVVLVAAPWPLRLLTGLERTVVLALVVPRDDARRVAALEASRRTLTENAEATLRRIERDLHDGTQARLVGIALLLSRAQSRTTDPGPRKLIGQANNLVAETMVELREIIRGAHPPVLDHGLATAITTLAARCAVPTTVIDDLSTRLTGPTASTLYYAAAELLTNITRHAGASTASVRLSDTATRIRLSVTDDGHGGAPIDGDGTGDGTGLPGLRSRVRALDGTLHVSSPAGGPTTITVDVARI